MSLPYGILVVYDRQDPEGDGPITPVSAGLPVAPDSLTAWADRYHRFAVLGVRSNAVTRKLVLHRSRFIACQENPTHATTRKSAFVRLMVQPAVG